MDIDARVNPDVVGSMTDMSLLASDSVHGIFSAHNIEHLYPHEVFHAFREFLRVLDPCGFAVITCPDLKSICALIAQDRLLEPAYVSPAGPIAPIDVLYGLRSSLSAGNLYMAHHCGFTEKVLFESLLEAGFASVISLSRPANFDLWAVASKVIRTEDEMKVLAMGHIPTP